MAVSVFHRCGCLDADSHADKLRLEISAHATSAGGLAGIVSWLAFNHLAIGNAAAWVSGSVVLVGLIATSRLILNRHTLGQVCAGAALGFAVEFILLSL